MQVNANDQANTTTPAQPVTMAGSCRFNPFFGVRGGLPLADAFDHLTVLLGAAIGAVEATEQHEEGDATGTSCAVLQLNLAYDLLQAMHAGFNDYRKQIEL